MSKKPGLKYSQQVTATNDDPEREGRRLVTTHDFGGDDANLRHVSWEAGSTHLTAAA
ncbi:MAG: hypothetical protein ABWX85_01020 [Arthrobacter sp.]|uniref:hypothetical protein n=1 Tax=Arthrobacter sp. TaxID=1667 RepID=UPI003392D91C